MDFFWVNFNCKAAWHTCSTVSKGQTNLAQKQLTWRGFSFLSIWGADNAEVFTTTLASFSTHRENKVLQVERSSPPSFAIEAISWIKYRVYHSSHVTVRRLAVPALSSCRCLVLRLVLPSSNAQRMQPHCNGRHQTHPRKRMLVGVCSAFHASKGRFSPTASNPYKYFPDMLSASKRDRHV